MIIDYVASQPLIFGSNNYVPKETLKDFMRIFVTQNEDKITELTANRILNIAIQDTTHNDEPTVTQLHVQEGFKEVQRILQSTVRLGTNQMDLWPELQEFAQPSPSDSPEITRTKSILQTDFAEVTEAVKRIAEQVAIDTYREIASNLRTLVKVKYAMLLPVFLRT